jgi:hypothetical protein
MQLGVGIKTDDDRTLHEIATEPSCTAVGQKSSHCEICGIKEMAAASEGCANDRAGGGD